MTTASEGRLVARHLAVGPPRAIEMIAELGAHPREQ
jgi:hypothetical protein